MSYKRFLSLFSCLLWAVSAHAQASYLNGNAYSTGSNCYVLTNAAASQKGSVWFGQQLNLNNSFDLQFMMNFGINDGSGGDGMTFVLQRAGTNAIGAYGGTLAYLGLTPSLAVEFDTYQNAVFSDPGPDHLAVVVNGNLNHTLTGNIAGPVSATSTMANIEDGSDHRVRIKWNPVNDSLHVYFDCELRLAIQYDMQATVFSGNPMVWWGFTASGGGAFNRQGVCILPTSPAFIRDTTICRGDTVKIAAPSGSNYSWSPSTGVSNPNMINPDFFPAVTTRYYVQYHDECNEPILDSVLVHVSSVVLNLGADTNLCDGHSVVLEADSGYSGYVWQNGSFGRTCTASASGYYAAAAVNMRGCYGYDSIYVNVLPPLSLTVSPNSPVICAGDSISLSAFGGTMYSWLPATGLSGQAGVSVNASPLSSTNYRIVATDSWGCIDSMPFSLLVNQLPVVQVSSDTSICSGASAPLFASGGINYSWNPVDSLSSSVIGNPLAKPAITTTYNVNVTDVNGCASTGAVTIGVNTLPVITTNPDTSVCIGSTVQLAASGGINYSWSPATGLNDSGISNPIAAPVNNTTYSVTVTDTNGCYSSSVLFVDVNQLPVISITPGTSICPGSGIQLIASGGVTYDWSPASSLSNSTVPNPIASPFIQTDYSVTVTDSSGCMNQAFTEIAVHPELSVTMGSNQAICAGITAQLNASGGLDYSWSPETSLNNPVLPNPLATPDSTTTYVVLVRDSNGCTGSGTTTVVVNPRPVISIPADTAICLGYSVQLSSSGGILYSWDPPAELNDPNISDPIASPVASTSYVVTVTDTNGCASSAGLEVTVKELPVVNITPDTAICVGSDIQLMASGGIAYAWSPLSSLSNAAISNPVASPLVLTDYTVHVTDASGCVNQGLVRVDVHPLVNVAIFPLQQICIGSFAQLQASGGIAYSWVPDSGLTNPSMPDPIASPLLTTTYVVNVLDANGCTGSGTTVVEVNPLPVIQLNSDTAICAGSSVQLSSSGGVGYLWNPPLGLSNQVVPNPFAAPLTSTVYSVFVTDSLGCSDSSATTVSVHSLPTIQMTPDTSICIGSAIQLSASGGVSYSWSPSSSLTNSYASNPIANPTNTTLYSVVVTDSNGCYNNAENHIVVKQYVNLNLTSDYNLCKGSSTQLIVSGGSMYSWYPTNGLDNPGIAGPLASPESTTHYTVLVSETNKCATSGIVTVQVHELPEVTITPDTLISLGSTVQLMAEGGVSYAWSPGTFLNCISCDKLFAAPLNDMEYMVAVTDSNGCVNHKEVTVRVEDAMTLHVPNAFTPENDDGKNDLLLANGIGIKEFRIIIYDRWGKLVFESHDIAKGWDGTYNGQLVQNGAYVYFAEAVSFSGKTTSLSGSVTLIK